MAEGEVTGTRSLESFLDQDVSSVRTTAGHSPKAAADADKGPAVVRTDDTSWSSRRGRGEFDNDPGC